MIRKKKEENVVNKRPNMVFNLLNYIILNVIAINQNNSYEVK